MKKVIREVKDLKCYMNKKITCIIMALIIAFFINYIPVILGSSIITLILLYIIFTFYAYGICLMLYGLFTPYNKKVKASDFDVFLINNGEDIMIKKIHFLFVNPFKKTITYITKTKAGNKVKYVFDFNENTYHTISYN